MLQGLPGYKGRNYEAQPETHFHTVKVDRQTGKRTYKGGELGRVQQLLDAENETGKVLGLQYDLLWLSDLTMKFRELIEEFNADRSHEMEGFGWVTQHQIEPGVWADVSSLETPSTPTSGSQNGSATGTA